MHELSISRLRPSAENASSAIIAWSGLAAIRLVQSSKPGADGAVAPV